MFDFYSLLALMRSYQFRLQLPEQEACHMQQGLRISPLGPDSPFCFTCSLSIIMFPDFVSETAQFWTLPGTTQKDNS